MMAILKLSFARLLHIAAVLMLGTILAATLVRFAPGYGADDDDLNSSLSPASRQALRLARSPDSNFAVFYFGFCKQLLRGDLGFSVSLHEPVYQLLAERIPVTAQGVAASLSLAWALGLTLAIASALPGPRILSWTGCLFAGVFICIPAAVLALGCVLAQLPGRIAVGLIVFPRIFQFTRNLLVRSAALPHVLTARAKGQSEGVVMVRHVLPVAGPQLLALVGVSICTAFAACIPVEALCDIPGLGQLAWQAALGRDLTLLVDLTMIVTVITLVANLLTDLFTFLLRDGRP